MIEFAAALFLFVIMAVFCIALAQWSYACAWYYLRIHKCASCGEIWTRHHECPDH